MVAMVTAAVRLAPGGIVSWVIVGLIAGALAGRVVEGRGLGCLGDIIVGVVGAFLGGLIVGLLGFQGGVGFFGSIVVAFVGAVVFLALLRAITGGRV